MKKIGLCLFALGYVVSSARADIIDGIEAYESEYKFVRYVKIDLGYGQWDGFLAPNRYCTAIQIGPRSVITSSSCVGDTIAVGAIRIKIGKEWIAPVRITRLDHIVTYTARPLILTLQNEVHSTEIVKVAQTPVKVGEKVTLVAYGSNDNKAVYFSGVGTKRFGMNTVDAVTKDEITFESASKGTSDDARMSNKGDEGGALLNANEELVGILASTRYLRNDDVENVAISTSSLGVVRLLNHIKTTK